MGVLKLAAILALAHAAIFFAVINLPLLEDFTPISYTPNLPTVLEGPLAPDGHLDNFDKLCENEVFGPESLALSPAGEIFTGGYDGVIRKISNNRCTVVARVKHDCKPSWNEPVCGRPLGMRFDGKGTLHFLDPYYGYFQMDPRSGSLINVVPSTTVVEGYQLSGLDDLEFGKNVIYFSQVSLKYPFNLFPLAMAEHEASGRLLQYDVKTKEITVLARNLTFPNGIQLSRDGSFLMVAETFRFRILKFDLATRRLSVLVDQLPGDPDNIRPSETGGYWVALNNYRAAGAFNLLDLASSFPRVRLFGIKLAFLAVRIVEYVGELCSSPMLTDFAQMALNPRTISAVDLGAKAMIVKFDDAGKILKSHSTKEGTLAMATEVLEHRGELYVGSWKNAFVARVKSQA